MKNRILAISDIHGYGDLLMKLLEEAAYDSKKDTLVLLGDYVNKGPDSKGTIKCVNKLVSQGAIALAGNHEYRWIEQNPKMNKKWGEFILRLPVYYLKDEYIFVHSALNPKSSMSNQDNFLLTGRKPVVNYDFKIAGKTVVFGHTSTNKLGVKLGRIYEADGLIGIDTCISNGGRLTLVDLTNRLMYSLKKMTKQVKCRKMKN